MSLTNKSVIAALAKATAALAQAAATLADIADSDQSASIFAEVVTAIKMAADEAELELAQAVEAAAIEDEKDGYTEIVLCDGPLYFGSEAKELFEHLYQENIADYMGNDIKSRTNPKLINVIEMLKNNKDTGKCDRHRFSGSEDHYVEIKTVPTRLLDDVSIWEHDYGGEYLHFDF